MTEEKLKIYSYYGFWVVTLSFFALDIFIPKISYIPAVYFLSMILTTLTVFTWVYCDSKIRGARFGPLMKVGVIALAAIVTPIYLIQTRGWKTASIKLAKFIALLLLALGFIAFIGGIFGYL